MCKTGLARLVPNFAFGMAFIGSLVCCEFPHV